MNLKISLTGPPEASDLRGVLIRFENRGMSPLAVIRSYRPGFYASHELRVTDAGHQAVDENVPVRCCGTPYALTADALITIPPGESREISVDSSGYALPPGRYRLEVRYRTNRAWLGKVSAKPAGFEHLAEGEWTTEPFDLLVK
jgi:hypothetical protein